MTETIPHYSGHLIDPHATRGSWNPAMRPENALDASDALAFESTSASARTQSSQHDDAASDNASEENAATDSQPQILTASAVADVSETAASAESTLTMHGQAEDRRSTNISWVEDANDTWDVQTENPFQREDITTRTNSFPAEEPTPMPEDVVAQETADDVTSRQEELHAISQTDDNHNDTNNNYWDGELMNDEEDGFFDQLRTQTKPIYVPPEAESRFEEGIPLVEDETETQAVDADNDENKLEEVFGDDEEDDFFTKTAAKDSGTEEKSTIHRKSTMDVLNSLDSHPAASSSATNEIDEDEDDLAARWQAELDSVEDIAEVSQPKSLDDGDDLAARWQAELDDDDDDLLDTNVSGPATGLQQEDQTPSSSFAAVNPYTPQNIPPPSYSPKPIANPYAPHQPSSSELSQGLPNGYASTAGVAAPPYGVASLHSESESSAKAHSFVDQARVGYKSPYDLPESLAPRPRRPPVTRKTLPNSSSTAMAPPPPRSNSISTSVTNPIASPAIAQSEQRAETSPSISNTVSAAKSFFEELPVVAPRQRPGSRSAVYSPITPAVPIAPAANQSIPSAGVPPPFLPPLQSSPEAVLQNQLQAPERIGPYANLTVPTPSAGPAVGPRYSPKPPSTASSSKSASVSRYSPAPPSSQPPSGGRNRYVSQPNNLAFQPRTSSPLAHHEKTAYDVHQSQQRPSTSSGSSSLSTNITSTHTRGSFSVPANELVREASLEPTLHPQTSGHSPSPPPNPYAPVTSARPSHPLAESPYFPGSDHVQANTLMPAPNDPMFAPPRRSQTQSPGRQSFGPSFTRTSFEPVQRPASVHAPSSPTKAANPYAVPSGIMSARNVPELNFILPTDGRQLDPLQRWKGGPIFKFAFGGLVSLCFPQHIPRYTVGQMEHMIQPGPGEARIRHYRDILPSEGDIVRYPGPLRTKSKKKDVLAWLSSRIAAFENEGIPSTLHTESDGTKRHEEKILLWKVLRLLVEKDGTLQGNSDIEQTVRNIVSPELESISQDHNYASGAALEQFQPTSDSIVQDSVAPKILQQIKTDLLSGNREKAVWLAVDNRLWGHAMVISSSLDKELWKQVVQEFVRREVRSNGENVESLAALYAIISGNTEESIDELIPPSARLGLQMVSKEGQGINKSAVDGLERWRETLGLIISNRTPDDHQALCSMAQLLLSYGRIEASHICLLFAKAFSQRTIFGGADDPQASIVLLGVDHLRSPTTFFRDEDAIALTEIYEFATSILAGSTASVMPYLQPYKLQYAYMLLEKGLQNEAMQYCDAIGSVLKASTKPSPYYHQYLFSEIDELATRLKQTSGDGGSSWISKPSMEKVSGTMWARFSSFVAGDESDTASNASGMDGGDVGPFAKVTEAATISRPPSVSEVYGSYPMAQPASNAFSRYAPATSQFAPSSSPEQQRTRNSMESQRSPSIGFTHTARRGSQEPATPIESSPYNIGSSNIYGSPTSFPYHSTPPQSSYVPLAPVEEDLATQAPQLYPSAPQQSALTSGLQASPERFGQPLHTEKEIETLAQPAVPAYGGYEPPTMSSYEPPSYQPDLGLSTDGPGREDEQEESEEKPKKKSFMDDDYEDDLAARAAAIQKAEKSRRDREADDAVRKAAEADAQRPTNTKKGWFGGWWGGKKEGESLGGGPIRAKLGEENSFYYDPELKKWVNKKDPNSAIASTRATPPPPKGPGPQSRSVSVGSNASSVAPPPPGGWQRPPSMSQFGTTPDSRPSTGVSTSGPAPGSLNGMPPRSVSSASAAGAAAAAASTSNLPPGTGGPTPQAAPPRPSTTSLSNASSIDDLLGAPTARKGGTVKSKKKGRGYVDVMAK